MEKAIIKQQLVTKISVIDKGKLNEISASEVCKGCIGFLPVFDNIGTAAESDPDGTCRFTVIEFERQKQP